MGGWGPASWGSRALLWARTITPRVVLPLRDFWHGFSYLLSGDERVNSTPGDFHFFVCSWLSTSSSVNHSYPTQSYFCCILPDSSLGYLFIGITGDLVSGHTSILPLLSEIWFLSLPPPQAYMHIPCLQSCASVAPCHPIQLWFFVLINLTEVFLNILSLGCYFQPI